MKIKNSHSLMIGTQYRIISPVYDDYNEGLSPETDVVEVISKAKNSLILRNVELNFTYEISHSMLMNCDIYLL